MHSYLGIPSYRLIYHAVKNCGGKKIGELQQFSKFLCQFSLFSLHSLCKWTSIAIWQTTSANYWPKFFAKRLLQSLFAKLLLSWPFLLYSMSFIPHITNVTCKATKVLNFIKCNLYKCSQYTKSNVYLNLVWPSLEYASSVWDPYNYYKTHNLTIEKVQRRATHLTLGSYDYHSSVSAMLQDLN